MSVYSIVDATGELLVQVDVPDQEHLAANTPAGATAVPGAPPDWNSYYQNGAWVGKPAAPSTYSVWNSTSKTWQDPRTLAEAQADKWNEIRAARDAAQYAGFTWDGSMFDSDEISQSRIQGAAQLAQLCQAAGQQFSVTWTLQDNSTRVLSAADMYAVGLALGAFVQGVFNRGVTLRQQIDAATSIDQLQGITWTA